MENRKIRVAITHGDTNGIGYELIFKTFAEPEMLELCTPIIYGSPKVAAYHRNVLGMQANFTIIANASEAKDDKLNIITTFDEDIKVDMGLECPEGGKAALSAIDKAIADYKDGLFDVLVLGPASENNINPEGFNYPGHLKYIEACLGDGNKGLRVMVSDQLRMALATDDVPLRNVASAITFDKLSASIKTFSEALKRNFRISLPRIAVMSLNPQVGNCSNEEQMIIAPAINQLVAEGIGVFGPFAVDDFFSNSDYYAFDGVLAMYHDQGVAPFVALSADYMINFVAGMPVVVTSADMNPRFDIAGMGNADETSFRHAIYCAIDAYRNSVDYDEPMANPLPKLYHEKRDDSEKVRFAIPKKHENAIKERQQ